VKGLVLLFEPVVRQECMIEQKSRKQKRESKGPGSYNPLQGHFPSDLRTSQKIHCLPGDQPRGFTLNTREGRQVHIFCRIQGSSWCLALSRIFLWLSPSGAKFLKALIPSYLEMV
jgi:hypothetical protein